MPELMSVIERCPLFGVSVNGGSTVHRIGCNNVHVYSLDHKFTQTKVASVCSASGDSK